MTTMLKYYLSESCKGNKEAAYEAARIMTFEHYNDVLIQNQYRRSAELGYAPAQRDLGILGLCSKLITPTSTVGNITYYNDDFAQAICWLKQAAKNHDGIAIYLLSKCYQQNIGVEFNEDYAQRLFVIASKILPLNQMIIMNVALSSLSDFNTAHESNSEGIIEDELIALVG